MAADIIGKATVTIVPQIDMSGMLENLDAEIRAGVAKHLRALADELSLEKDTDEPRYSAVKVGDTWGIAHHADKSVWAAWGDAKDMARAWAGYLNDGTSDHDDLAWKPYGQS